jgi:hypothetical protein
MAYVCGHVFGLEIFFLHFCLHLAYKDTIYGVPSVTLKPSSAQCINIHITLLITLSIAKIHSVGDGRMNLGSVVEYN